MVCATYVPMQVFYRATWLEDQRNTGKGRRENILCQLLTAYNK